MKPHGARYGLWRWATPKYMVPPCMSAPYPELRVCVWENHAAALFSWNMVGERSLCYQYILKVSSSKNFWQKNFWKKKKN